MYTIYMMNFVATAFSKNLSITYGTCKSKNIYIDFLFLNFFFNSLFVYLKMFTKTFIINFHTKKKVERRSWDRSQKYLFQIFKIKHKIENTSFVLYKLKNHHTTVLYYNTSNILHPMNNVQLFNIIAQKSYNSLRYNIFVIYSSKFR